MYVCKTSHCSLYHFGVISVGGVLAAVDGVDAEPIGYTDDGAEVARILHAIERECENRGAM